MKVSTLIEQIRLNHKPEDRLIVLYWSREWVENVVGESISDEHWKQLVESVTDWAENSQLFSIEDIFIEEYETIKGE